MIMSLISAHFLQLRLAWEFSYMKWTLVWVQIINLFYLKSIMKIGIQILGFKHEFSIEKMNYIDTVGELKDLTLHRACVVKTP